MTTASIAALALFGIVAALLRLIRRDDAAPLERNDDRSFLNEW